MLYLNFRYKFKNHCIKCMDYVSILVYILSFSFVVCTYDKEFINVDSLSKPLQNEIGKVINNSSITDVYAANNHYKCDFEDGICFFLHNDLRNTVNWTCSYGTNISRETGPHIDNTLRNGVGGFAFVDVNKARANAVRLESGIFRGDCCVRFFYHMAGNETGELRVSTLSIKSQANNDKFVKKSSQGEKWKEAIFNVNPVLELKTEYKIVFTAKGKGLTTHLGHIAIDDVEIYAGRCKNSIATELCTFDEDDYKYTSYSKDSLKWAWLNPKKRNNADVLPNVDHTIGTPQGGYWYFRTSNPNGISKAKLVSPVFSQPGSTLNCLQFSFYWNDKESFWYGGMTIGYVEVILDNFSSQETSRILTIGKNTTVRNEWNYVETPIEIGEKFKLEFQAVIESKVDAVIAIDDVKITRGNCQESDINSTEYTTVDFSKTTEAYNFTLDLNETSYITDDYNDTLGYNDTIDFFETTYWPGNFTISENETTYWPENFTISENETTYWPDNFTINENETTYWPDNFTLNENETTYWPDDFTINENETTYNSSDFVEFNSTTIYPLNFTQEYLNETQFPSNITSESTTFEPDCDCGKKSISCVVDRNGNIHCLCVSGTFQLGDVCTDCDCGRNSSGCYFERNGIKRCICDKNFSERKGTCAMTCKTDSECLNGGNCEINYYENGFCACRDGYSGDRCEVFGKCIQMQPLCSQHNAVCRIVKDKPFCECPPDKVYSSHTGVCENICDPKTCFNGKCEIMGKKFRCRCDEGYTGELCDVVKTNIEGNEKYTGTFYALAAVVITIFIIVVGLICISITCRLRRRYKS